MTTNSGYRQLAPKLSQIRLLHLQSMPTKDHRSSAPWYKCVSLECTFETVHLASAPPYEALSYTWGDEDASVRILLNGEEFLVRPNLAYALAALRISEPRVLWVDALCINQQDTTERNHQVGMMRDIFRRAERVLVWLGRPSSGWDSSVAGALEMAKKFGENPPASKLPPPPPQPIPVHESQFDQWINLFPQNIEERKDEEKHTEGSYESRISHWQTCQDKECQCWHETREEHGKDSSESSVSPLQKRLNQRRLRWKQMRDEHERYKGIEEGLPAMMKDTKKDLPCLAQTKQKLDELLVEEHKQKELLNDLMLSESEQLTLLQAPQQRLLQDFKDSQMRDYQEYNIPGLQKPPEAREVQQGVAPELGKQFRPVIHVSGEDGQEQGMTDRLFDEILADLGKFQGSIYDLREQLRREWASPPHRERVFRLEKMQQLDMDQRRGLAKLRDQLRAWQQPTDKRYGAGLELLQSQLERFERRAEDWEALQKVQIENLGDLPKFITEQYESLQRFTKLQYQALEGFKLSPGTGTSLLSPSLDAFLSEEEIQISEKVKSIKQEILKQQVVLRSTELKRWEIELVIQQSDRWRSSIYEMERQQQINWGIREESVEAQLEWIQLWRDMVTWEAKEWHDRVFTQTGTPPGSPELNLLSLERICCLSYWRRLWIVQEVLLAKELVLCFGDDAKTTKPWDLLTRTRDSLEQMPSYWKFSPAVSASMKEIRHAFPLRLDKLRKDNRRSWPLHKVVDITINSLCRDPKDKVYGLLGITSGFQFGDFDVRYEERVEDVYRNVILWYHSKYGEDVNSPNPVSFSQLLQLSLKNAGSSLSLDGNRLSVSTGSLCMKKMITSPILPIEKLIGDEDLWQTRRRDWISTLVEYLDDSGFRGQKTALEEELLYLDSVSTTLSMPTSSAYAVTKEDVSSGTGSATYPSRNRPRQQKEPLFFVTDRKFGISSASIREGDLLCRFPGSNLGVILRRGVGQYNLVSKAIMSSITKTSMSNIHDRTILDRPKDRTVETTRRQSVANEESSVDLMLDITALLSLTIPLDIVSKHEKREPLCIQETSFGWFEFYTWGLDVAPCQKQQVQTQDCRPKAKQEPNPASTTKFKARTSVFYPKQTLVTDDMSKLMSVATKVSLDIDESYPALHYPDPMVSTIPDSNTPVSGLTTTVSPYKEPNRPKPKHEPSWVVESLYRLRSAVLKAL
ncbi:heterokaryon incompatibility 6 OR allele [Fusarium acutatum]|uniref:Heterokaryon incompatibility 6 OR allele n=1 Tax=Fusarium acutatum TaxID=78861 RepID=A0A8H4K507_9HYPO|nr:heterokaryon incompatibility 6 OR allele [Fusarium acutatum]